MSVGLSSCLVFVSPICLSLAFCVLDYRYFVLALFAFVVLGLVSSVLCQDIGWEDSLRNDLFCVEWDVKPEPNQPNQKL